MKYLLFLFSICLSFSILSGQNLVSNPGFENWTGGDPDNWTYEIGVTIEEENSIIYSGSASAKVTLLTQTQANTDTQNTEFIVVPGNPFTSSVWVYDNDPAGRVSIYFYWDGASTTWTNLYSVDQDSWQQLTYAGTVPAGATGLQVSLRFYDESAYWDGDAIIYIDDVFFEISSTYSIITAYNISNTAIDLIYNGNITSVSPGDYTLTGTAAITFSGATIDGSDATLVHLTGASAAMNADLTLDTISDGSRSSYTFYAGIMQVDKTNTLNPAGHIDDEHFATFLGVVTANDNFNNVWIHTASGPYNGVMIYDNNFDALVEVGDEIQFSAKRYIYNGMTELVNPLLISATSVVHDPASFIAGSDIRTTLPVDTNPGEKWEGQLVRVENALVESYDGGVYEYTCTDDGGTTHFLIGDNVDYHFGSITLNVGTSYNITGVVDYSFDNYRLNPRNAADVTEAGGGPLPPPENLVITRDETNVYLTWDAVTGAVEYNIYSDFAPDGSFSTLEGTTSNTNWFQTVPAEPRKFYLVTAQ